MIITFIRRLTCKMFRFRGKRGEGDECYRVYNSFSLSFVKSWKQSEIGPHLRANKLACYDFVNAAR